MNRYLFSVHDNRLRICFVDSFLPGQNVPKQAELLAQYLKQVGATVLLTSNRMNPVIRLFDVVSSLLRHRRNYEVACIQAFSGKSLLIALCATAAARFLNKYIVVVLRGGNLPRHMKRQAGAIYWLLAKADRIVAPSDYLGQACRDLGFRAHIIPNIIGIDHYQFRDRSVIQPRLFWLRALHPTYNPKLAIKTLSILRRTYPEAALTMAGPDKGELEDCQKLVSELALKGAVHFTGFLNKEQINSIACEHDIFLNTARIDNCPVTVLEAMAMGLPVVSTKIGGLPFLLRDNEEALLVGDDNPVEMAKAVICLVKDSQLVKRLTMAARAKVEGYTWPTVRPLWLSVLAGRRINGSRSIERPAANIQS